VLGQFSLWVSAQNDRLWVDSALPVLVALISK
jgi:hypothetical protein